MIDYYYSLKPINKVAFSNNGNYIAASCRNGSVLILDPLTLSIVKTLNTTKSSTNCIAFHKIDNSKLLVGGSDNILQIWAITLQLFYKIFQHHLQDLKAATTLLPALSLP